MDVGHWTFDIRRWWSERKSRAGQDAPSNAALADCYCCAIGHAITTTCIGGSPTFSLIFSFIIFADCSECRTSYINRYQPRLHRSESYLRDQPYYRSQLSSSNADSLFRPPPSTRKQIHSLDSWSGREQSRSSEAHTGHNRQFHIPCRLQAAL